MLLSLTVAMINAFRKDDSFREVSGLFEIESKLKNAAYRTYKS